MRRKGKVSQSPSEDQGRATVQCSRRDGRKGDAVKNLEPIPREYDQPLFPHASGMQPGLHAGALRAFARRPANPDPYALFLERQLSLLVDAMNQAGSGNMHLRLPATENEELSARLGTAFNRLVGRLAKTGPEAASQPPAGAVFPPRFQPGLLADLSHELRTPLNSLLMLARLLTENEGDRLTPKQLEYAKTIHSAGKDLLSLITEIVDLSKIESGELEMHPRQVPLSDFRDYVEGRFRPAASRRGIGLRVRLAPEAPCFIRTDALRLQQVLGNLVQNALKLTEHGEIAVDIGCAEPGAWTADSGGAAPALVFSVRGVGIPCEKQVSVFAALQQQLDAAQSPLHGGFGLGLAISRALVQLLGGVMELQSVPGSGSVISVYLPAGGNGDLCVRPGRPAAPVPPDASTDASVGSTPEFAWLPVVPARLIEVLSGRRTLVIEHDARDLFALTCLIERCHAHVLPASSIAEALALLEERADVEVVLMDLMLPGADGCQAMRLLRALPRYAALPIVALTAGTLGDESERIRRAGCSACLSKPLETTALVRAMEQVFPR